MTTRSVHLLTTAAPTQENVVHASTGLTIVTNGFLQVLYVDTEFADKAGVARALRVIADEFDEATGDTAFTGTR